MTQTTDKPVTINAEQELYVIPCGDGYTCLGFDVCIHKANAAAAWLRQYGPQPQDIPAELRGTLEAYRRYSHIMELGGRFCHKQGKRCPIELTPQLNGLEDKRVEVVDCYGETRRFWVGKSTGWMPCHLEIKTRRSTGGGAVMGAPFQSVRIVGQR